MMRALLGCLAVAFFSILALSVHAADPAPSAYTLSGPFTHDNLTIYLIHGADKVKGKVYVTLQEAMEKKMVIVHETSNVNELVVENVSDQDVYIQSGDIVKGGKQDRTLQYDLISSARSKMPINAFCVEAGRWRPRGGENAVAFASSELNLATKAQKVAARSAGDQNQVWEQVAVAQQKLSSNTGENVQAQDSASSLQLSLENKKVQEAVDAYRTKLANAPEGKSDVVGYAFAINGKLNSVDIYVSNAMFGKLWEKNLRSSSTEAFAELKKDARFEPAKAEDVTRCLDDAAAGKANEKELNSRVRMIKRETKDNWQYETYDAKTAAPAHINILTRDPEMEKQMQQRQEQQRNAPAQQQLNIAPNPEPRQEPARQQ
jgi:hypothetical protein